MNFINFKCFFYKKLSMLKSFSTLRNNNAHLIRRKDIWKKIVQSCFEHAKRFLKHHQFASSFEQWNFISNETSKGKKVNNSIYYAPLVIFQKYKIIVLNIAHTPCASFYCVCTGKKFNFQIFDKISTCIKS